jgi:hypothetical protein
MDINAADVQQTAAPSIIKIENRNRGILRTKLTESDTEEIKKTIIIDASPEVVFIALIDETELTQWFSNERIVLEAHSFVP